MHPPKFFGTVTSHASAEGAQAAVTVLLTLLLTLVPPVHAFAADPACEQGLVTAAKQFAYARSLNDEGEYFRAVGEGKRYLAFYDSCGRVDEARLLVGAAYLRAGQWDSAGVVFRSLAAQATGPVGAQARLGLGDTLLRQGRYPAAVDAYAAAATGEFSGYARYRAGFAHFLARDAAAARASFAAVPAESGEAAAARRMLTASDGLARLPTRSPSLAGVFSAVVPGAGQVYTGRYADGVVSLLVNGAFIGGTVEAFRRDLPVVAVIVGLFEMGWYTGNIFSAVNYAHRFNERVIEGYQREWQQRELIERDWAAAAAGETRYLRFGLDFE